MFLLASPILNDMNRFFFHAMRLLVVGGVTCLSAIAGLSQNHTVAHQWNEQVLEAIRNDFARPTVHARNLYHSSILMYDCWAAYDTTLSETIFWARPLMVMSVPSTNLRW